MTSAGWVPPGFERLDRRLSGAGGGVAVDEAEGPPDRLKVNLLQRRIVPVVGGVSQNRIEDPAAAVGLRPRGGKVAVLAMHERVRQIQPAGVEVREHTNLRA